ncbi:hypothetical protein RO3G_11517 [Rhizopus delemar RA 99-880]|uniref:Uncharacterized protein n=1 Tax=Rhizopus delemar (strain RA 99-880 / ATCC MYA-4621 / FGSC 9543 / NRRL 43880) TaxID=246409 RepID=I1CEC6_RHIO9|nr:hypothetical protein RO3G_11517 [Rhizopus delemar RA 99-880]|eukprot:EIE86806.1 hypothetical protein RO3G_11517 [Rhizopus delemar RA 99-880]
MQVVGIDKTQSQSYSIRSASSTKAVELGHSVQDYSHQQFNFFLYGQQHHIFGLRFVNISISTK